MPKRLAYLPLLTYPEPAPDEAILAVARYAAALDLDLHASGFAVGYYSDVAESVVLATSDGGATWRVERVVPGELLRSLFLLDARHAWAAGDRARTTPQVVLRRLTDGESSPG